MFARPLALIGEFVSDRQPKTPVCRKIMEGCEKCALTHLIPDANRHRFYVLRTLPTLFGDWVLLREWGRIGSPGRLRRDCHTSESDAISALAKLAKQKHRRGYALQEML